MELEEKALKEQLVYKGQFLNLRQDEVLLPNGKTSNREYFQHPGSVAILVVDKDENIYIERQYRYPLRKTIYEIPAGKLEKNEDIFEACKRELNEETGLIANNLIKIGEMYPCVGYSDEVIHLFLVDDFTTGKQHLDEEEFVDVLKINLHEIKKMILEGIIKDSKTVYSIYLYELMKSK